MCSAIIKVNNGRLMATLQDAELSLFLIFSLFLQIKKTNRQEIGIKEKYSAFSNRCESLG